MTPPRVHVVNMILSYLSDTRPGQPVPHQLIRGRLLLVQALRLWTPANRASQARARAQTPSGVVHVHKHPQDQTDGRRTAGNQMPPLLDGGRSGSP